MSRYSLWKTLPLASAISVALSFGAQAQVEGSNAAEPAELDDLTVTGSRLKRSDVEGPTPVIVLERAEFEEMGYRTVQDGRQPARLWYRSNPDPGRRPPHPGLSAGPGRYDPVLRHGVHTHRHHPAH